MEKYFNIANIAIKTCKKNSLDNDKYIFYDYKKYLMWFIFTLFPLVLIFTIFYEWNE